MKKSKLVSLCGIALAVLTLAGCGGSGSLGNFGDLRSFGRSSGRARNPDAETLGVTLDDLYENNTLEHYDEQGLTLIDFYYKFSVDDREINSFTTRFRKYDAGFSIYKNNYTKSKLDFTEEWYVMNDKDVFCRRTNSDFWGDGAVSRSVYSLDNYESMLPTELETQMMPYLQASVVEGQSEEEKEKIVKEEKYSDGSIRVTTQKTNFMESMNGSKDTIVVTAWYVLEPETLRITMVHREFEDDGAMYYENMDLSMNNLVDTLTKDDIPQEIQRDYFNGNFTRTGMV